MDFTLKTYRRLLSSLSSRDYTFQTFSGFLTHPSRHSVILRHDVDRLPENSLIFARLQHEMGIRGTYYFRIVPESFDEKIIYEIASMGHEIGYHYEDLSLASVISRNTPEPETRNTEHGTLTLRRPDTPSEVRIFDRSEPSARNPEYLHRFAIELFQKNLERMRRLYPVTTICMHGSPRSGIDNRDLWKFYDYRDFGITGEPYFDLDFSKVLYLTDTGRRWDGEKFSVRDKSLTTNLSAKASAGAKDTTDTHRTQRISHNLHSTTDIITACETGVLPDQVMFTFHPQRWSDNFLPWIKELVWQRMKNGVKYWVVKKNER